VVEDATSLLIRKKSFTKVTYDHPRYVNDLVDVHEVIPEVRAHGVVRANIDASASASSDSSTSANGESYRVLVKIKNS